MRHLICFDCSKDKKAGGRLSYGAGSDGPAEYERVVFGTAKEPLPKNRVMTVIADGADATKITLPQDHHDCDSCGKSIKPGDRCCAHSAWVEGQRMPQWEAEYIEAEPYYNPRCAQCGESGVGGNHGSGPGRHTFAFGPLTDEEKKITGVKPEVADA